jgi:hypothetical protein
MPCFFMIKENHTGHLADYTHFIELPLWHFSLYSLSVKGAYIDGLGREK